MPKATIGKTTARGDLRVIGEICPAALPGDRGTAHFFNGDDGGERPEVGVGEEGVGVFYGF